MRRLLTMSTVALVGCGTATEAASPSAGARPLLLGAPTEQAVAIVRIRAPWYAPGFMIRRRFRSAVPEFTALPGLLRKYFTLTDDCLFGGIYLWNSRQSLDNYFNAAWHERMRKKYGKPAQLDVFDAPFVVEGTGSPSEEAAAALLTLEPRAGEARGEEVNRLQLERTMVALNPAPGLVRTYLLRSREGQADLVTLWTNRAAAQTFLTSTWTASAGVGKVTWFAAPVVIEGAALHQTPGERPGPTLGSAANR